MARLAYLCERRGLPSLDDQRAALAEAGLTAEELAAAYVDRCLSKPAQPQRNYMTGNARKDDELWVSRPGVLATTEAEALRFASAISESGAVLRVASTGGSYRVVPDVADTLRLIAAIREDERRAVLERARKGLRGKPAGKPKTDPAKLKAAERHWFNADISGDEAARRAGIGRRVLHREFGPRNTPAFGKKEPTK